MQDLIGGRRTDNDDNDVYHDDNDEDEVENDEETERFVYMNLS